MLMSKLGKPQMHKDDMESPHNPCEVRVNDPKIIRLIIELYGQ